MSDLQKHKTPRKRSSEKSPTKVMERPGSKPHPESDLTKDRYEEGSNAEVAGLYADPLSDEGAVESRDPDNMKRPSKKGPKQDEDADPEGPPGFQTPESDQT